MEKKSRLAEIVGAAESEILADWMAAQSGLQGRMDKAQQAEQRSMSREFLEAFRMGLKDGCDPATQGWAPARDLLTQISSARANQGFSPSETATFVFSLKQPVFSRLRHALGNDAGALADEMWNVTSLVDRLGLITAESYQKAREEVISRQQRELLELSTPVVELWEGVLALPLIGTLDSGRTQVVMESLLEKIVQSGAAIAIIDITGVPTVDTLVAQHLMKTVAAARLMGADCIISGIRPQIAQTIVHLGVDLAAVTTKASLSDAFAIALQRNGLRVERAA